MELVVSRVSRGRKLDHWICDRIDDMKRYLLACLIALACFGTVRTAWAESVSTDAIYSVLIRLPVAVKDRKDPYKPQQLKIIATAIESATQSARWKDSDRVTMAALLITTGYYESRFAIRIHDWDPKRYSYSYGIWQVTPQAHHVQPHELVGLTLTQTESAARIAARVMSKSRQCGDTPEGWFTAYYGGVSCGVKWRTLTERVNTFWWVRHQLKAWDKVNS